MIHGPIRHGAGADALGVGELRTAAPVTLTRASTFVRVGAYLDGLGPGAGVQEVRAVLLAGAVELAVSAPVLIDDGAPEGWATFDFEEVGMLLAAGDYTVGVRGGAPADVARVFAGPGAGDAIFLETLEPFAVPDADDLALARLPWALTQRIFGAGGTDASSRRVVSAGWHGAAHDDEEAQAVAIARTGGPLEELVGERLRVVRRDGTGERVVYLYVFNEEDFGEDAADEDVSLPLRAWLELAPASADSVEVEIEVLK